MARRAGSHPASRVRWRRGLERPEKARAFLDLSRMTRQQSPAWRPSRVRIAEGPAGARHAGVPEGSTSFLALAAMRLGDPANATSAVVTDTYPPRTPGSERMELRSDRGTTAGKSDGTPQGASGGALRTSPRPRWPKLPRWHWPRTRAEPPGPGHLERVRFRADRGETDSSSPSMTRRMIRRPIDTIRDLFVSVRYFSRLCATNQAPSGAVASLGRASAWPVR
jgi:hypothetical protein